MACRVPAAAALMLAGAISTVMAQQPAPRFDVVSVKRNTSGPVDRNLTPRPNGVDAINLSMKELLHFAFRVEDFQLADLPGWMTTDRFDVVAKTGGVTMTPAQINEAMRALLVERFHLEIKHVMRDLDGYELVVARSDRRLGPDLRVATVDCGPRNGAPSGAPVAAPSPCRTRFGTNVFESGRAPIARLAERLAATLGAPVANKTGLEGEYEIKLRFSTVRPYQEQPDDRPVLFTALQEQLGLKLARAKVPVEVLIVRASASVDLD